MAKSIITLILIFSCSNLFASSQTLQKVNNDVISIDGQYARRTMTQSEKLKKLRERLEKKTELTVKRKIEELRFMQEVELSKKIQQAFNQKMEVLDHAFDEDQQEDSTANL